MLLGDILEHGYTVNADGYCATLESLQVTVMSKHTSPNDGVIILHIGV
jgi:hypothetical protein